MRRGRDLPASSLRQPLPEPTASLAGQRIETGAGVCFLVEERYPLSYRHGHFSLGSLLREPLEHWAVLATTCSTIPSSSAKWVFLDTETTGLADGAGTYAFLVGLGCFEGDSFHLAQFFLPSPMEERALLQAVAEFLQDAEGLITFNGRSFDLPLLQGRYTMARLPLPWQDQVHLDLLLPARRLWRDHLASCSLSSLEAHLLGVERSSLDLPGWRIPSVYYDYLRGADSSLLEAVFYHNAQDILSLVTLATRLARFLRDPWGDGGARHGLEFFALGRLYEQREQPQDAIAAYRAALLLAMPVQVREQAWQRLSLLLKRQGAWEEALEIWESLLSRPEDHPLYAYVELAKYHEHRSKDLARAEYLVQQAIGEHGESPDGEDLRHRLCRVQRKRRGKE